MLVGTPCAAIRWRQEREELQSKLRVAERARDDFEANWRSAGIRLEVVTRERDELRKERDEARDARDTANALLENDRAMYRAELTALRAALETAEAALEKGAGYLDRLEAEMLRADADMLVGGMDAPTSIADDLRAAIAAIRSTRR
jgi:chromosome segregation ATPase